MQAKSRTIRSTPMWTILIAGVAAMALFLAACGNDDGTTSAAAVDESAVEIDVELGDLYVDPGTVEIEAGQTLVLNVTNAGAMPHDLVFEDGPGTQMLDPGESETIEVTNITESTSAWCTVVGHREAGMEMFVEVTDA